jgi:acyl-CoA synthetase (AMP-forming)/AMP-acid ligase II
MKTFFARLFAKKIHRKNQKWIANPHQAQEKTFNFLLKTAQNTQFGKDHNFKKIENYQDFKAQVPVRNYEGLRPYVERILQGEKDILWPGQPLYLAKTSGTTSGAKFIPLTKASMPTHITAARDALLNYIHETGNTDFVTGKQIFLQGSPVLEKKKGIAFGRLSGIVAHYVPSYLQTNRMPSWETNCIEDWETKVSAIVEETVSEKMTLIAGIPSWVQMYFERLKQRENKAVGDIFPHFSLFVYGGVNYKPYRALFEKLIGRKVDSVELFPASEGFFAYQDRQNEEGLLLLLNNDIFYEFIEADTFFSDAPKRICLEEVVLGVNYVLILNTSAGLWGYNIGDTVQFVSKAPYRLIVSGRIKHFISAFGEHVIGKEVESALQEAMAGTKVSVREFTVAPQIAPQAGLPFHEWLIDFNVSPEDPLAFAAALDTAMRNQNIYYDDLIRGNVLQPAVVTQVNKGAFEAYMKSIGKLGGQNKVPRLTNDRSIADELVKH